MLILVTANDFLFFKDLESVALAGVFFLDEEDFAVGTLADDADLGEILSGHSRRLLRLAGNQFLILLDFLLALDNLKVRGRKGLLLASALRG